jgi:xanthine dehydrogenase accessory factor
MTMQSFIEPQRRPRAADQPAATAAPVAERMNNLIRERVPFVRVTVVRAQKPTSVRPGNEAIVLADGSIEGFVGGVCAEESVRRAALGALSDGESLLLRVLPDEAEPFPAAPGALVVQNPCLSGGAMEMFLEPLLPTPLIQVVGDSPISLALRNLAPGIGFEICGGNDPDQLAGTVAVIISSLGRNEVAAIRAALAAGVPLIGLVASPRRGAAVLDELGLAPSERARVHTPIGLWIGARTAEEIAVSIVAELIKAVRIDGLSAGSARTGEVAELATAIDPVCGMTVTIRADTPALSVDGEEHWFCCGGCRDRFAAGRA